MSILVTGASGALGRALVQELVHAGIPVVATYRSGKGPAEVPAVRFDWDDQSTYNNPFEIAPISAAFLVAPYSEDAVTPVKELIELAVSKGTKRFVVVGGRSVEKGGPWMGEVWEWLSGLDVQFSILRPLWFNENFLRPAAVQGIKQDGAIYSGFGDGLSSWISTEDIATVARIALTAREPQETYDIGNSEELTIDEIAGIFSKVLGRDIRHIRLDPDANIKRKLEEGPNQAAAYTIAHIESMTARNVFHGVSVDDIPGLIGRPMVSFGDWVKKNTQNFV